MRILIIGDSLTGGYGIYESKSWSNIYRNTVNHKVIVKTYNGAKSSFIFDNLIEALYEESFDIIVLSSGTNDILSYIKPNETFDILSKMIKYILSKNIKLLYLLPPGFSKINGTNNPFIKDNEFEYLSENITHLREKIMALENEKNNKKMDNFSVMDIKLFITQNATYTDGVHFNEEFHRVFAIEIEKALNNLT